MVDFNNDNTIGTPAVDIVRVLVLEKRTNVIEALEAINKRIETNTDYDNNLLKARIQSLYWELEGMFKRKAEKDAKYKEEFVKMKKDLFAKTASLERLSEIFSEFNTYLDQIRLTRIDNKSIIDTRRVERVNRRSHL